MRAGCAVQPGHAASSDPARRGVKPSTRRRCASRATSSCTRCIRIASWRRCIPRSKHFARLRGWGPFSSGSASRSPGGTFGREHRPTIPNEGDGVEKEPADASTIGAGQEMSQGKEDPSLHGTQPAAGGVVASDGSTVSLEPKGQSSPLVLPSTPNACAGLELGPVRLIAEIGRGGMGAVYRAHHKMLGRDVAVKLLHGASTDEATYAQFLREVRAAAAVHGPCLVPGASRGRAWRCAVPGDGIRARGDVEAGACHGRAAVAERGAGGA